MAAHKRRWWEDETSCYGRGVTLVTATKMEAWRIRQAGRGVAGLRNCAGHLEDGQVHNNDDGADEDTHGQQAHRFNPGEGEVRVM